MPATSARPFAHARRGGALRFAGIAMALVGAMACGDAVGPTPGLSGRWNSPGTGGSGLTSAAIQLDLTQQGDELTGAGKHTGSSGTIDLIVTGFVQGSVVMLSLDSDPQGTFEQPMQFSGVIGGSRGQIDGTLTYRTGTESRTFYR